MPILYVVEQGARVTKTGERIIIRKESETLQTVPAFALEQVVLFGNIELTPPARNFLLDQGIDTVFMSMGGRFRGRLSSFSGNNIELRQTQFAKCQEEAFLLDLAQRFVQGKLANCRTLLRRHQRRAQSEKVEKALVRMRRSIRQLESGCTLDQVRGHEGDGSASYFGCLTELIKQPGFEFRKRTRRPPRDPFNAILSFGYTMLLGTVLTAIQVVGLDPFLGALHAPRNGRPSIALDLMEEFRPLLVDSVAIRMVNRRQLLAEDFEYQESASPPEDLEDGEKLSRKDYPVLMGPLCVKKWIAVYDDLLQSKVDYPRYGCRLRYQQIVTEQARLLVRHFQGEEEYQAYLIR